MCNIIIHTSTDTLIFQSLYSSMVFLVCMFLSLDEVKAIYILLAQADIVRQQLNSLGSIHTHACYNAPWVNLVF